MKVWSGGRREGGISSRDQVIIRANSSVAKYLSRGRKHFGHHRYLRML